MFTNYYNIRVREKNYSNLIKNDLDNTWKKKKQEDLYTKEVKLIHCQLN